MNYERAFLESLERLQTFGGLRFSAKQFYYEFCRALRSPFGLETKTAAALFGASVIPAYLLGRRKPKNAFGLLTASALTLSGLAFLRRTPHILNPPVSWVEFENLLLKYQQNHKIAGLLEIESDVKFTNDFPADLTLYGLPRVLICESDEIAEMLRKNDFHLQTPCAVLSLHEASPLGENYQKMLARAAESQVLFLHDASLEAFSKIENLRETLKLNAEIPLRPIGLRPVHAMRLHLFAGKAEADSADLSDFDFLSDDEKRWLENGNKAEVSAVSPVRLLRVLRRIVLNLEVPENSFPVRLPRKDLGFM